jgi:hypothetical protein
VVDVHLGALAEVGAEAAGAANHSPLTMLPSSVPWSCSRNEPRLPATVPVTRSMPTNVAVPSGRAACRNSTTPSPSMSPLKLSSTWILVSAMPSATSS